MLGRSDAMAMRWLNDFARPRPCRSERFQEKFLPHPAAGDFNRHCLRQTLWVKPKALDCCWNYSSCCCRRREAGPESCDVRSSPEPSASCSEAAGQPSLCPGRATGRVFAKRSQMNNRLTPLEAVSWPVWRGFQKRLKTIEKRESNSRSKRWRPDLRGFDRWDEELLNHRVAGDEETRLHGHPVIARRVAINFSELVGEMIRRYETGRVGDLPDGQVRAHQQRRRPLQPRQSHAFERPHVEMAAEQAAEMLRRDVRGTGEVLEETRMLAKVQAALAARKPPR